MIEVRPKAIADQTRLLGLPQGSGSVHLDALRGLAAFAVLLVHWRSVFYVDYAHVPRPGFLLFTAYTLTDLGHQAVMVFFVLSGYLVGGSVLRAVKTAKWSWREYLIARLSRLYIVLAPALVLGAAFDWTGVHLPGLEAIYGAPGKAGTLNLSVSSSLTLRAFLGNFAFLQSVRGSGTGGHVVATFGSNIPLWSLSNEFWYYIAFPIAVLALSRSRTGLVRSVYAVALVLWCWFVGPSVVTYGIPWFIGAAIHSLPRFPSQRPWARRTAIIVALAMMAACIMTVKGGPTWAKDMLFAECAAAFVWVVTSRTTGVAPEWYARLAHGAARNSYTLYLVHLPFLIFLKAVLHVPLFDPTLKSLVPTLGLLAVILGYTRVAYLLFEKHTDALRQWLRRHAVRPQRTIGEELPGTAAQTAH